MEFIISFTKPISMVDYSSNPSNILKILHESLKLLNKTKTLILPLLLLSSLFTSFLLLTNYLSISPLLLNLSINLYLLSPTNPLLLNAHNGPTTFHFLTSSTHQLLTKLTLIQSIFISISFLLHSSLLIATTHITTMAYNLKRTRTSQYWKYPMITLLHCAVFALGFILLFSSLLALLFFVFAKISPILCMVFNVLLGVVGLGFVAYFVAVSMMGLVVSAVEEGCYGLEAVGRGMEMMMERGRKKQGILISLVVVVVSVLIYGGYYGFFKVFFPELVESPLVNLFVGFNVGGVMSLVSVSVYTVLYFEWRSRHFLYLGMCLGV